MGFKEAVRQHSKKMDMGPREQSDVSALLRKTCRLAELSTRVVDSTLSLSE
jgi:hypothetical protein